MEIHGANGFKAQLSPNKPFILGRQNLPNPKDQSISRAHISLSLTTPTTVTFRVIGKNPVWVSPKHGNDGKVKVFNASEMGELSDGDMFCLSFQHPVWFTTIEKSGGESEGQDGNLVGNELSQSLESGIVGDGDGDGEFEGSFDISHFNPVQDFGFLVIGHEFDRYKKQINHDMKKWNWFLEDTRGESDDDNEVPKKRGGRSKRKKARDDDVDEEWTGESEDEVAVTTKARKVQTPKYRTRSKDPTKKDGKSIKKTSRKDDEEEDEDEDEDEDDVDETLGGFIVDDDPVEEDDDDDGEDEMDEEEDEFVEDELDD